MTDDFEIGRVIAVDTAQVTVELNSDMKALTLTTYEGVLEVGHINSYVVIPVGPRRLVAVVTRVEIDDRGSQSQSNNTVVVLPAARRIIRATLIGMINSGSFTQGLSVFPVLDNPVFLAAADDIDCMFDRKATRPSSSNNSEQPGFCVHLGESVVFKDCPIYIDPDSFFGKHAAILGGTGSGKSCTIASILQSILNDDNVRRTNFVIIDTNGEYRSAFQQPQEDGSWKDRGNTNTLYIPSDQEQTNDHLAIPYWFLNTDDFIRLFQASERVQAPVLMRALQLARAGKSTESSIVTTLNMLRMSCDRILAIAKISNPTQLWAIPSNMMQYCKDVLCYRSEFQESVNALECAGYAVLFENWETAFKKIYKIAYDASQSNTPRGLSLTRIQQACEIINPVIQNVNEALMANNEDIHYINADQPLYFGRSRFLESALEVAMREQADEGNYNITRDSSPMLFRIRRFFDDPRFNFLFEQYPDTPNVLATFLRDVLGLQSEDGSISLPLEDSSEHQRLPPFYKRQSAGSRGNHIVILDLSLLANEVLETVVALIGRLILEFLRRLGEVNNGTKRGSLPVVLVLEEAQNYIAQSQLDAADSISRTVFERIAREGRKYGLGLVVASQRPSELSRTILSQCGSFVVHRLQNPEDLRYFREIVPSNFAALLEQLPSFAPQIALVLGECVRAPVLVRIRDAQPIPLSDNPRFYEYWVDEDGPDLDIESVCARWEGKIFSGNGATPASGDNFT